MNVVERTALLVQIAQAENRKDWEAVGHLKAKLARPTPAKRKDR